MKEYIFSQLESFNFLMILVMITFVSILSKSNMQKQLKELSQELYNDFEEIKDEIRGNTRK
jgi:ABC-type iron transport system FetAB permease component